MPVETKAKATNNLTTQANKQIKQTSKQANKETGSNAKDPLKQIEPTNNSNKQTIVFLHNKVVFYFALL